jgi:hypothetical protein
MGLIAWLGEAPLLEPISVMFSSCFLSDTALEEPFTGSEGG